MALRKSFINIGWKLDESGLRKANKLTDDAINNAKKRSNETDKTAKSEEELGNKVKDTNNKLNKSASLAGNIGKGLKNSFGSFDNASKSLTTAGNNLQKAGKATRGASLAVGAGMAYSAKTAMDLQQSYKETTNLLVNGGEKQKEAQKNVNKMTQDGAKYSQQYGKSQKELASGYEELVKRGYTSNQALGAQKSLLQASIASGDSYSDVVHNSTAALESFGMRAKSTSGMIKNTKEVTNEMAYAADATATDFSSMGTAMTYVGATAHQSGMSLHETASAIGILSNNGIEADKAGTGLRKALVSLQSPTKRGTKALGEMGLSTDDFVSKSGKMKSMTDIFGMLNSHTKNMSNVKQGQLFYNLFGATGQQSATILANNAKQLGELDKKVQDSSSDNYVQKIANKNMGTAKMQLARFKQATTAVGVDLAKEVLPDLTKLATKATVLLEKFDKMPNSTKKLVTYSALAVTALSPMLTIIGGASKGLGSIVGLMGKINKLGSATAATISTTGSVPTTVPKNSPILSPTTSTTVKSGLSGASKLAIAGVGIDVGANIVGAVHAGLGSKQGGKDLWQGAGTGIGAAIGSAFGPAGIAIGGTIGNKIGDALAKSKVIKDIRDYDAGNRSKKGAQKGKSKSDAAQGGSSFDTGDGTVTRSIWSKDNQVPTKTKPKVSVTDGLSKPDKNYYSDAIKLENKANASLALSAGKSTKSVKDAFDSLYTLAKDKSSKRLKEEKTNLDYLQKQGLISSKDAKKQYEDAKTSSASRLKSLKSQLNDVMSSDKLSGTKRVDAIKSINKQILSLTDAGSKKQKALLTQMNKQTSKLSAKQYSSVLKNSNKAYKATVKSADKTYSSTVTEANKKYKAEKKAANSLKGISEDQRKKIIAKAKNQKSKTIANAETQRDDTIQAAKDQRSEVVKQAQKQAGEMANAFTTLASDVANSIPSLINQNMAIFGGQLTKTKSSTQAISDAANPGKTLKNGSNQVKAKANGIKIRSNQIFAKATGGAINRNQNALVGEQGHELAYNPRTGKVRILGTNGPAIQRLYAGEHILNARDTRKVMSGGIGAGKTLKGFAGGTDTLASFAGGTGTSSKVSVQSSSKVGKSISKGYAKGTKDSQKSLKDFNKKSKKTWNDTQKDTDKSTNKIKSNSVKDYKSMANSLDKTSKSMNKTLNKDWNGTVSDFNTIFGKLDNYSHSAMKSAIGQLNGGIKGIDTTLGKFGGNGSVLPLIHYASGTRGPISKHTMAVVNDAKSGPKQEAIVRNGHALMASGNDVVTPLQPGDEVLNGHETQAMQDVGLLPHFAKGTGALKRLAAKNKKDSSAAFNTDFSDNVDGKLASALASGIKGSAKAGAGSTGKPWYGAMWNVIGDAIAGGAAGGAWRSTPGLAKTNGFGAYRKMGSHDGVDYSGALGSPILAQHGGTVAQIGVPGHSWPESQLGKIIWVKSDDGYQEIYQEFGGMKNIKVSAGDVIKTGQEIATLGTLHGAGSGSHVHVGLSKGSVWDHGGSSTAGWLDISKMHGSSNGSSKSSSKKDTRLEKLAKAQLGKKAISWIGSNLADQDAGGSSGATGPDPTGSHKHWMEQAGIPSSWFAGANKIISAESGWNPRAQNPSSSAYGIPQALPGSKMASAGKDWKTNPITQLKWFKSYINSRYGSMGNALSFRSSHGWYAKGGNPQTGQDVIVGENGPELARFKQPATIYSNPKTNQMLNTRNGKATASKGGNKNTFNINITVKADSSTNGKAVGKQIGEALQDKLTSLFSNAADELA